MQFKDLQLNKSILKAIAEQNYDAPTPVQQQTIPLVLSKKDVITTAQTGTGKTAAFLITAIVKLVKREGTPKRVKASPRVLILAPTRELVQQIEQDALDLIKYQPIKYVLTKTCLKSIHQDDPASSFRVDANYAQTSAKDGGLPVES